MIVKHQIDTSQFRTRTSSTWGTTSRFVLPKSNCRIGTRPSRRPFSIGARTRVFKQLLAAEGCLERWYAFEAEQTERALRDWCKENQIDVVENGSHQSA